MFQHQNLIHPLCGGIHYFFENDFFQATTVTCTHSLHLRWSSYMPSLYVHYNMYSLAYMWIYFPWRLVKVSNSCISNEAGSWCPKLKLWYAFILRTVIALIKTFHGKSMWPTFHCSVMIKCRNGTIQLFVNTRYQYQNFETDTILSC